MVNKWLPPGGMVRFAAYFAASLALATMSAGVA
jgi:hypothetical protein